MPEPVRALTCPATIHLGAMSVDFLVDADDSAEASPCSSARYPRTAKVPVPHSHDAFEETIYGLEGVCTWTIDGGA
jgi:hypothetical protein